MNISQAYCTGELARTVAKVVLKMLPTPSRVVDVGCGPGAVDLHLVAAGHEIIGVDADQALHATWDSLRRPHLRFIGEPIKDCIDGLGNFDAAIFVFSLHHLAPQLSLVAAACERNDAKLIILDVYSGSALGDWMRIAPVARRAGWTFLEWARFAVWRLSWHLSPAARAHTREDVLAGRLPSHDQWSELMSQHGFSPQLEILCGDSLVMTAHAERQRVMRRGSPPWSY